MDNRYYDVKIDLVAYSLSSGSIISRQLFETSTFKNYVEAFNFCEKFANEKPKHYNDIIKFKAPSIIQIDGILKRDITPEVFSIEQIVSKNLY